MSERPAIPRCHQGHPMRAIQTFKFGHEESDSPRDTDTLNYLQSQGVELTGETWVMWYCERCDFAMAQPAEIAYPEGNA